jgi:PAS domain S-box-containing protein
MVGARARPGPRPGVWWWLVPPALTLLAGAWLALVAAPHERALSVERWRAQLSATADDRKASLDHWLYERFGDAAVLARDPDLARLVVEAAGEIAGVAHDEGLHSRVMAVLESVVASYGYRAVMVLGPDGRAVAAAGPSVDLQQDCLDLPRRSLASGRPLADFHLHAGATPVVQFAAPLPTEGAAKPAGAVVLVVDPAVWVYPFLRHQAVLSDTAETVLLRPENGQALYLTPLRHRPDPPLTVRRPINQPGFAAAAAIGGQETFTEYVDYRGVPVFAATRRLVGAPWGLVAKVDQNEALLPYRRFLASALAGLAAVFLATSGLGYGLWHRQRSLMREALSASEHRLAELVEQANDAVFVLSTEGRVLQANRRGVELYGYSVEELRGLTAADLRAPETRDGVQGTIQEVLQRGAMTYETINRRQDGSLFPVEVSSRRAYVGGEEFLIATVRDITPHKAAEARIRRLNRLLRTISEINELIVRERDRDRLLAEACRILVEDSEFQMVWVGFADEERGVVVPAAAFGAGTDFLGQTEIRFDDSALGAEPTGTAIREQREVVVLDWATDPTLGPWREAGRARGFCASASFPLHAVGMPRGALAVYSGAGAFDDEVVALLKDLAEDLSFAMGSIATDEALVESEDKFRYFFEHSIIGKSITRPTGEVQVNRALAEMLGYRKEELQHMRWQDFTHPDDIELTRSFLAPLLAGDKDSTRLVKRYLHRGGTIVWADVATVLRRDREGSPLYFITSVLDITERMQAEEQLRQSEGRYRSLFENMREGFAYCRMLYEDGVPRDFVYLEVNPSFERLTGLRGVAGKRVSEVIPGIRESNPELFEVYGRVALTGAPERLETYVERLGSWLSISVYGPRKEHFVAVFDNITERKRAEAALRQSERLYRAIGESIDYGVWVCDPDGRNTYASESFLKLVGITQEQCSNFGWGNVLHPDDAKRTIEAWKECVRTSGEWDIEHRFRGADGKWHTILARGVPVRNDRGEIVSWAGINLDISERKRAEEQIRKLNAELEQRVRERTAELEAANTELEAFSYSVSHDLRAPLRAINGFARIVLEDFAERLDSEGKRHIEVIRANTQKMDRLIDDLLAFSQAGRGELRCARVAVGRVVRAAFAEVAIGREEQGRIDFSVGELPDAWADPALIHQVWVNLLSNAVKFSRPRERAVIRVTGARDDHRTVYHVSDNGVGFDMRYADKLFGVFQRLHSNREFEGTGVGLALVQRIIHRHGGEVWGEGAVDGGATFSFALPEEVGHEQQ